MTQSRFLSNPCTIAVLWLLRHYKVPANSDIRTLLGIRMFDSELWLYHANGYLVWVPGIMAQRTAFILSNSNLI
jgi:hypothetical protein